MMPPSSPAEIRLSWRVRCLLSRVLMVLVLAVVAMAVGMAAAYAPQRIKLLWLFALGVALITALLLEWMRAKFIVPSSRCELVGVALCLLWGQLALAAESYEQYSRRWREHLRATAPSFSTANIDPEQRARFNEETREIYRQLEEREQDVRRRRSFTGFLRHRQPVALSSLSDTVFFAAWLAEMGFAVTGGVLLYRSRRPRLPALAEEPSAMATPLPMH